MREWSAARRPNVHLSVRPFPAIGEGLRLAALHAVSLRRRAALLAADPLPTGERVALTISELLAGGHSASGRSPGAARALKVRFLEPAGTASSPTDKTPHDSAPGRIGRDNPILC